jgi:hypothetical protein
VSHIETVFMSEAEQETFTISVIPHKMPVGVRDVVYRPEFGRRRRELVEVGNHCFLVRHGHGQPTKPSYPHFGDSGLQVTWKDRDRRVFEIDSESSGGSLVNRRRPRVNNRITDHSSPKLRNSPLVQQ